MWLLGVACVLVSLAACVASSSGGGVLSVAAYERLFSRQYSTLEASWRRKLVAERLAAIELHNADPRNSWKKGVNQFTDKTPEELQLKGLAGNAREPYSRATPYVKKGVALPPSYDWRQRGVLTAVKNQGGCGSCWAFSATEAIEAAFAIATGRLEQLSEQQVLECVANPLECGGDGGCSGGTPQLAFSSLVGMASEWSYSYTSFHGNVSACKYDPSKTPPIARVSGYVQIPLNDQDALMEALVTMGPVSVNLDASAWHTYSSGVFDGCDTTPTSDVNHAVLLVGYGTDAATGLDFWTVRNSWSTAFGEAGYIRLLRTPAPTCVADVQPYDGSACKNVSNPVVSVTVCGECGILFDASLPVVTAWAPGEAQHIAAATA